MPNCFCFFSAKSDKKSVKNKEDAGDTKKKEVEKRSAEVPTAIHQQAKKKAHGDKGLYFRSRSKCALVSVCVC